MISPLDLKYLFEEVDEHPKYEAYLKEHIQNVKRAYEWLKENLPDVVNEDNSVGECCYFGELDGIIARHDASKYNNIPDSDNYYELKCEYQPYVDYFYGEQTDDVKTRFDLAWLSHIHNNPHHWQHWLLQNDEDGLLTIDMPYVFIVEMLCDHWSFSWKNNNLTEVFDWYNKNKSKMILSDKTRSTYESMLEKIKNKLEDYNAQ